MSLPQIITVAAFGWIGYQVLNRKKGKRASSPASDPTTPHEPAPDVDEDIEDDDKGPGGSDPDGPLPDKPPTGPAPPGPPKPTPPIPKPPGPMGPPRPTGSPRPTIPTGPTDGPPLKPPTRPEAPPPLGGPNDPSEPDEPEHWPDYPPPVPVDLSEWTDPGNYPTPGMFHQIGGPNSATTLQAIARKALTTAFYLALGDLDLAKELAQDPENWRVYRDAINCSAWNHALYGAANEPGASGAYDTPHGDSISMFPVHANVASQLANGEPAQRRVRLDDRRLPAGGRHALIWLPPLDEAELLEGRVVVRHDHWWTGDWVIMPPPEVLTLGVVDVPPGTWGCGGYETVYEFEEGA